VWVCCPLAEFYWTQTLYSSYYAQYTCDQGYHLNWEGNVKDWKTIKDWQGADFNLGEYWCSSLMGPFSDTSDPKTCKAQVNTMGCKAYFGDDITKCLNWGLFPTLPMTLAALPQGIVECGKEGKTEDQQQFDCLKEKAGKVDDAAAAAQLVELYNMVGDAAGFQTWLDVTNEFKMAGTLNHTSGEVKGSGLTQEMMDYACTLDIASFNVASGPLIVLPKGVGPVNADHRSRMPGEWPALFKKDDGNTTWREACEQTPLNGTDKCDNTITHAVALDACLVNGKDGYTGPDSYVFFTWGYQVRMTKTFALGRINPKDGKPYDGLFVGFVGTKLNLNKPSPKGIV